MKKHVEDPNAVDIEKVPIKVRNHRKTPPSLRPDVAMMDGCVVGHPAAKAIRDAWRFQANRATKCIVMSPEDFAKLVERAGQ